MRAVPCKKMTKSIAWGLEKARGLCYNIFVKGHSRKKLRFVCFFIYRREQWAVFLV